MSIGQTNTAGVRYPQGALYYPLPGDLSEIAGLIHPRGASNTLQYKQKHFRGPHLRPCLRTLVVGLTLAAAAGCTELYSPPAQAPSVPEPALADEPVAEEPPSEPPIVELTAEERVQIHALLDRAHWAVADDQLTSPYSGSALEAYDQVLRIQPDHPEARRGLEKIVERYLELALTAASRRQFTGAQGMLDRALIVDPDHPGIVPMQTQINMLRGADRRVVTLDGSLLRDQDQTVKNALAQAGSASRRGDCRIEIFARNDAEGRWIYQQLSSAEGRERIRAQLNIGSPPRIELLCFKAAS